MTAQMMNVGADDRAGRVLAHVEMALCLLRAGRAVRLGEGHGVWALELTPEGRVPEGARLVLPSALGGERDSGIRVVDMPEGITAGDVMRWISRAGGRHELSALLRQGHPGELVHAAAIELCKLAGLLPAALVREVPPEEAISVGIDEVLDFRAAQAHSARLVVEARLPIRGAENARLIAFRAGLGGVEHVAIVIGEPDSEPPLCRLHSACFTGDLLGSLRCDCGDQLSGAVRRIAAEGNGLILYLAQEGRGIGLVNKLRAYRLQDAGLDTVEANEHLGFMDDERDWLMAAIMLRQLGHARIRLLTNNPAKVSMLERHGIEVVERVPHEFAANPHNRAYLATKAEKCGHHLEQQALRPSRSAGERT